MSSVTKIPDQAWAPNDLVIEIDCGESSTRFITFSARSYLVAGDPGQVRSCFGHSQSQAGLKVIYDSFIIFLAKEFGQEIRDNYSFLLEWWLNDCKKAFDGTHTSTEKYSAPLSTHVKVQRQASEFYNPEKHELHIPYGHIEAWFEPVVYGIVSQLDAMIENQRARSGTYLTKVVKLGGGGGASTYIKAKVLAWCAQHNIIAVFPAEPGHMKAFSMLGAYNC